MPFKVADISTHPPKYLSRVIYFGVLSLSFIVKAVFAVPSGLLARPAPRVLPPGSEEGCHHGTQDSCISSPSPLSSSFPAPILSVILQLVP